MTTLIATTFFGIIGLWLFSIVYMIIQIAKFQFPWFLTVVATIMTVVPLIFILSIQRMRQRRQRQRLIKFGQVGGIIVAATLPYLAVLEIIAYAHLIPKHMYQIASYLGIVINIVAVMYALFGQNIRWKK